MKISEQQILSHIPNYIPAALGETSLSEALAGYIQSAHRWFRANIADITIAEATDEATTADIIILDALYAAVPSLDLVLSPNGFATVGTQDLVPVSKARIEHLMQSLIRQRDNNIDTLLRQLIHSDTWRNSSRGTYYTATLFPDLTITSDLGITENRYIEYISLRHKILQWQHHIAAAWISPELMTRLRTDYADDTPDHIKDLRRHLRNIIILAIRSESLDKIALTDIVQQIKESPDLFPEWHSSGTAKLFSPVIFKNKKSSHGYFF